MFRKITTVSALVLVAVCAYFLYGIYSKVSEQQRQFEAKVDQLHREVLAYHNSSVLEAQTIAAALASPYYREMRDHKVGIAPNEWTNDDSLWNHVTVIRSVTSRSPKLLYASNAEQHEYLANSTPAYIILDLHQANQGIQDVLSRFYFWRQQIHNEADIDQVRNLFAERKVTMSKAIAKAESWR